MADSLRLFIALELPEAVLTGLREIQRDLERVASEQLRFVRPEDIHLTLKFLGEVDPGRVEDIENVLRNTVQPFELRLQPASLGGFGGRRIRVVWVGVEGDVDELAHLWGQVDEAMATVGFEPQRRSLAAHLTLARVRAQASREERARMADYVTSYEMAQLPALTATRVSLIRSHLGPGGARYETISRFPAERS